MDKNYLVTKSNFFIMHSNYDLSLEEQKIILTLASMVEPSDEEFKPYMFKISDFIKMLNIKNQSKYIEIPMITKELMKKVFEIQEGNKLIQVAWLSSVIYEKGSGIVILKFSPDLKPYMLNLNKLYTSYKLTNILQMKNKYSPRLYEILKCNLFKKIIEIKIDDLRKLLRVESIYPLYGDFKRKIIMKTQKELNQLTDINFTFEEIKTGRKVTSLRFFIESQNSNDNNNIENIQIPKLIENKEVKKNETITTEDTVEVKKDEISNEIKIDPEVPVEEKKEETDEIKFLKNLCDNKLNSIDCARILAIAKGDLERIKEAYNIAMQQSQVNNLCGFLISCIKNNYSFPVAVTNIDSNNSSPKKDTFNDYEQRSYDFDALERKLLGWDDSEDDEKLDPKKVVEDFLIELQQKGLHDKNFVLQTFNFDENEIEAFIGGIYIIINYKISINDNIVYLINKHTSEIIASKKF